MRWDFIGKQHKCTHIYLKAHLLFYILTWYYQTDCQNHFYASHLSVKLPFMESWDSYKSWNEIELTKFKYVLLFWAKTQKSSEIPMSLKTILAEILRHISLDTLTLYVKTKPETKSLMAKRNQNIFTKYILMNEKQTCWYIFSMLFPYLMIHQQHVLCHTKSMSKT